MNQNFKEWVLGHIDKGFREEARIQFLSIVKHQPQKVKDYIRDNLGKFFMRYSTETGNMSIQKPDDVEEIFAGLLVHFEAELAIIP
jgi:hypothetical protein